MKNVEDKYVELKKQVECIIRGENLSVEERLAMLLALREPYADTDAVVYAEAGFVIFEPMLEMLKISEYYDGIDTDIVICECLLAETYIYVNKTYKIAALARDLLSRINNIQVDGMDKQSAKLFSDVLIRICKTLENSGHPRLIMQLISAYFCIENLSEEKDADAEKYAARELLALSILTGDKTWLQLHTEIVMQTLSPTEIEQIREKPSRNFIKVDPVEYSAYWEEIIDDVEHRLEDHFRKEQYQGMGFCFSYWQAKRQLLNDEYGITWNTPSMMNPGVIFD